jgi:hypothetical protein
MTLAMFFAKIYARTVVTVTHPLGGDQVGGWKVLTPIGSPNAEVW